jgi:hypothetical protein
VVRQNLEAAIRLLYRGDLWRGQEALSGGLFKRIPHSFEHGVNGLQPHQPSGSQQHVVEFVRPDEGLLANRQEWVRDLFAATDEQQGQDGE